MYQEYCLTLPGGFELPVKLTKETVAEYDCNSRPVSEVEAAERMTSFAARYLHTQMIAGSITDRIERILEADGAWCLAGDYACTEMIGKVQAGEIGVIP